MATDKQVRRHKSLFISDVHLGTRGCKAEALLEFLDHHDGEVIYLVGDIVDGWRLRRRWYWPAAHAKVITRIRQLAAEGRRVVYIPGNHDDFLRGFYGVHLEGIEVAEQAIHETVTGKRYLVTHGDQFDVVVMNARWLALVGDVAYTTALGLNTFINRFGSALGLPYWSLSSWCKLKVKKAVNFIGRFEEALVGLARADGLDGVICGHIHHAAQRRFEEVHYINTGDWVESCTAVTESYEGTFEVIRWVEQQTKARTSRVQEQASGEAVTA
ncbi:UDP-2,3-diacylglucosamine diphosphatase [Rhodobacteraceae bacterium RKSG542]|uniref:UDP-2,3-diacylglucosamine diphosphatase n=1 Tax=Pseudovibrio flavus TaxID=2529854 RepID=UPI0012BBD896|nr:UDP-2,3-diacylglucosamine diphosphatase [Pseudovibrio flavus]MTI19230.1 UDP-2,3-diacylglucosamine diphosphatase [Pseudovibrio flavus]